MMRLFRQLGPNWDAARLLVLLALLLRSAIPSGYMLDAGHGDGMMVTLCGGAGPVAVTWGPDGAKPHEGKSELPEDQRGAADAPCLFAAATALSLLPAAPALRIPRGPSAYESWPMPEQTPRLDPTTLPPGARAPPTQA